MSVTTGGSRHKVSILYLGGIGRSGSTVLGRMLGSINGAVSVGEVVHLWGRGLQADHICGCGRQFSRCPYWSEVGERAFGGWSRVQTAEMLALQRAVDRNRYLPWLLGGTGPASYRVDLADYAAILGKLYRAAHAVAGGAVLIDTSKNVPYAWLLRRVPEVDLTVIHLVRDSRGAAYSWAKTAVPRPETVAAPQFMDSVPVVKLAARWSFDNTMFDLLRRVGTRSLFVRYEDVVRDPVSAVQRIAELVGLSVQRELVDDLRHGSFMPTEQHEVSGNPMRFNEGPVQLRPDVEWRSRMRPSDRRAVSALTAPLLYRYGYLRERSEVD